MLVGIHAILVLHLHALICSLKLWNKLTVLCCLETNSIADVDVLQELSCCCDFVVHYKLQILLVKYILEA